MADITVTVEKIGYEDISMGTGTFARTTSTGGSQNINKLNADHIPLNTGNTLWPASKTIEDIVDMLFASYKTTLCRSKFTWVDADTITIGPGRYYHDGTVKQVVYWDSDLTFDSTDTGTQWYYLYIDDSAIVTAGTNVLTAAEFINSTTGPTWSDAKLGWYNGEDRCIFAYRVVSGSIYAFIHDGGNYIQERNELLYNSTPTDNTTTTIDAKAPSFSSIGDFKFGILPVSLSADCGLTVGPDIANALVKQLYISSEPNGLRMYHNETIYINSSGDIEVLTDYPSSGSITLEVRRVGWYLPNGM